MMTLNDFISFYDFWENFCLRTFLHINFLFMPLTQWMWIWVLMWGILKNLIRLVKITNKFRKRRCTGTKYWYFQRQWKATVNLTNYLSCNWKVEISFDLTKYFSMQWKSFKISVNSTKKAAKNNYFDEEAVHWFHEKISFLIITFFIPSSSVFVLLKFSFDMISSYWKLFHDP